MSTGDTVEGQVLVRSYKIEIYVPSPSFNPITLFERKHNRKFICLQFSNVLSETINTVLQDARYHTSSSSIRRKKEPKEPTCHS